MKIAYFINQYPKVSHSFIRREIQALERQDIEILRYALRGSRDELADERDRDEYDKTRYVLRRPIHLIAFDILRIALLNPLRFVGALILATRVGWRSDRGLLRHFAYLAEACILAEWCRRDMAEHVHAHFGTNSAVIAMLCKGLGGPSYSFTVHGPDEFDKPLFIGLPTSIGNSAFVVAISSYGRSQLFRWMEFSDWAKVKIVHCGLEPEFHEGAASDPPAAPRLVSVGRLSEQKGYPVLLEAARVLKDEGVEFEIVLVGDGELRSEIEQLIDDYDLTQNLTITGWVGSERVREEIEKSRVFVLPSFAEGLPVVIMEAMALKRPVISTYIAGIPELVSPGENGWLVPAGDVDALANSMKEALAASAEILQVMGEKARGRVLQRHDIDTEAAKLKALFSDAISGRAH